MLDVLLGSWSCNYLFWGFVVLNVNEYLKKKVSAWKIVCTLIMLENLYIYIWKAVIIWDVKIKWLNPGITKRLRMNGSYNLWRTRGYCKWYAGYNLHALVRQSGGWPMLIACIFTITLTAAIIIAAFIPLAGFYEHILLAMERRVYLWLKLSYKILFRTSSHLVH